jgi:hypothetical protein
MRLRSVMTMALACAAGGPCGAGGFNTDGSTKLTQAFVVDEKNGHWRAAQGVAAKLNVKGYAEILGHDQVGQRPAPDRHGSDRGGLNHGVHHDPVGRRRRRLRPAGRVQAQAGHVLARRESGPTQIYMSATSPAKILKVKK